MVIKREHVPEIVKAGYRAGRRLTFDVVNALRPGVVTLRPFRKASAVFAGVHAKYLTHMDDKVLHRMFHEGLRRDLAFHGEFRFLANAIKPGMKVLDIGANVGTVSITLALKEPTCKIYAFEPDLANFAMLVMNLNLNDVKNVFAFNYAVGASDGFTMMYLSKNNFGDHRSYSPREDDLVHGGFNASRIPVRVVNPVKYLKDAYGADAPDSFDLIKVDTQGADFDVLKGVMPLCKKGTIVSIEFSPFHMGSFGTTWSQVEELLRKFSRIECVNIETEAAITRPFLIEECKKFFEAGQSSYNGYLDLALYYG